MPFVQLHWALITGCKPNYLEQQQAAISRLESDIAKLATAKKEVERLRKLNEQVNQQIDVIQALQAERGFVTEMLDYIAQNTPETVFLDSIDYKSGKVIVTGVASSDGGVAQFIRNMDKFQYFSKVALDNIKAAVGNESFKVPSDSEVKQFTINIDVKRLNASGRAK